MITPHARYADRIEALEHDYIDGEKSLAEVIYEAFDMGVKGATEAIPKPVGVDPDWRQKIELAKQARERDIRSCNVSWINLQGLRLDMSKVAMYYRSTGWQGQEALAIVFDGGEQRLYDVDDLEKAFEQLDHDAGLFTQEVNHDNG